MRSKALQRLGVAKHEIGVSHPGKISGIALVLKVAEMTLVPHLLPRLALENVETCRTPYFWDEILDNVMGFVLVGAARFF